MNTASGTSGFKIYELSRLADRLQEAIHYFWEKWGSETNFKFYEDCIRHSLSGKPLPAFFVGMTDQKIQGCYALLTNDLVSRQDLMPWFACLFVEESARNHGFAGLLLDHAVRETAARGFDTLYLSTDLQGFYEKKGWQFFATAYNAAGNPFAVYSRNCQP